jgi:hypothetical protein
MPKGARNEALISDVISEIRKERVAMPANYISRLSLFVAVTTIGASLFVLALFSGLKPAEADHRVTTGMAAATAGATVTPTAPKLKVEPK